MMNEQNYLPDMFWFILEDRLPQFNLVAEVRKMVMRIGPTTPKDIAFFGGSNHPQPSIHMGGKHDIALLRQHSWLFDPHPSDGNLLEIYSYRMI